MFGSEVLEVGLGLTLFFLIVSLICSAAREGIETLLKSRARDLERGIRELLDDPSGETLAKSIFQHGQVFSLFAGGYDPSKLRRSWTGVLEMPRTQRDGLPSYIPSGQFASALIDIVARGPGDWPYPVAPEAVSVESLRSHVRLLPSARVQRAVLAAIDQSGNDLDRVKTNLEAWYNGTMDRVSGWYKRRTQLWLFLIGLAIAASMNLDALTVTKRLLEDKTVRGAFVAEAARVHEAGEEAAETRSIDQLRGQLSSIQAPIGWFDGAPAPQSCASRDAKGVCARVSVACPAGTPGPCLSTGERAAYRSPEGALQRWRIGLVLLAPAAVLAAVLIRGVAARTARRRSMSEGSLTDRTAWAVGLVIAAALWLMGAGLLSATARSLPVLGFWGPILAGWLLTAGAVTFGAPFWFDVLNKFMVVRSTVKPREKSRDEGSEDRPVKAAAAAGGSAAASAAAAPAWAKAGQGGQAPPGPAPALPDSAIDRFVVSGERGHFEPEAWASTEAAKGEVRI